MSGIKWLGFIGEIIGKMTGAEQQISNLVEPKDGRFRRKMKEKYTKYNNYIFLVLGGLAAILYMIPFLILGEESVINYHDQLDGELIGYILNAKYLFKCVEVFPEIMNGIPVEGLAMPAPGLVILFYLFDPFVAFMIAQFFVVAVAFYAMYFFLLELTEKKEVAFVVGILFMLLPFYPVYGLGIPGQPLLWLALLRLKKCQEKQWLNYLLVIFYAMFSSLALVGFACVIVSIILVLYVGIKGLLYKREKACIGGEILRLGIAVCFLVGTYALFNWNLIEQVVAKDNSFVSHKTELVLRAVPIWDNFWFCLTQGVDYAKSNQWIIIVFSLVTVVVSCVGIIALTGDKKKIYMQQFWKQSISRIVALYIALILIAAFYGFYHGENITAFRNSAEGIIHDFNFDRFTWLMPVLWYCILAYSFYIWMELLALVKEYSVSKAYCRVFKTLIIGVMGLSICIMLVPLLMKNDIKANIAKIVKGRETYHAISWETFYAEDLFDEIETVIGKDKETYRVVSFGIYPAAAAYNGFYCLDAYSNNYDVNYKKEFRAVIAPVLEKSDYLREWYDGWGNRCYLVDVERYNYFSFDKQDGAISNEFNIDCEALKHLGCDYIISASYIMDAEEHSLLLLTPDGVESENSWYRLYVYQIK